MKTPLPIGYGPGEDRPPSLCRWKPLFLWFVVIALTANVTKAQPVESTPGESQSSPVQAPPMNDNWAGNIELSWEPNAPLTLKGSQGGNRLVQPGQTFELTTPDNRRAEIRHGGTGVRFGAQTGEFNLEVKGVTGMSMEISEGDSATLDFDPEIGILAFEAGGNNQSREGMTVRFPESASVRMGAGSTLRYDYYPNGEYALFGTGGVQGVDAQGAVFELNEGMPPYTNGPLILSPGMAVGRRSGPVTAVEVDGKIGEALRFTAVTGASYVSGGSLNGADAGLQGNQNASFELVPGAKRSLTFDNGTQIEFAHSGTGQNVSWSVTKGQMHFELTDLGGQAIYTGSEEAGSIRWNPEEKSMAAVNTGAAAWLVGLGYNREAYVQVAPGSQLNTRASGQYFEAAVPGGSAKLRSVGREEFRSLTSNWRQLSITTPPPSDDNWAGNIELSWEPNAPLTIKGSQGGNRLLQPGRTFKLSTTDNRRAEIRHGGNRVRFGAQTGEFNLEVKDATGLVMKLGEGDDISLELNPEERTLSMASAEGNDLVGGISVTLPDNGLVTMGSGSRLRYDYYPNGSYAINGTGALRAKNSAGAPVNINEHLPPMIGGPLVNFVDAQGIDRLRRATPKLSFVMERGPEGRIQIRSTSLNIGSISFQDPTSSKVGVEVKLDPYPIPPNPSETILLNNTVVLDPNRTNDLTFSNGSTLRLTQVGASNIIKWEVPKGLFEIGVDNVDGVRYVGETGSSGIVRWNEGINRADFRNANPEQNLIVALPTNAYATVPPEGEVLVSTVPNTNFFTASGVGAEVIVYNRFSAKSWSLKDGSIPFRSGQPLSEMPVLSTAEKKIILNWDIGEDLRVGGVASPVAMRPASDGILNVGNSHQVGISYTENGELQIESVQGSFNLSIAALNGMEVEVREGDQVSMSLDLRQGTFRVASSANNSGNVGILTGDGSVPDLDVGNALNFNFDDIGNFGASADGGNFETAGNLSNLGLFGNDLLVAGSDPVADPAVLVIGQNPSENIDGGRLPEVFSSTAEANN